jgi:hypothetical protein
MTSVCASAATAPSPGVDVKLTEFVYTQKHVGEEVRPKLRASIRVENNTGDDRCFVGHDEDGKLVLMIGEEGRIDFSMPPGEWTPLIGPGVGPRSDRLCIRGGSAGTVYIEWPLALLIDPPAETLFRVTLVDSVDQRFPSDPFKLHDGRVKVRFEVVD